MYGGICAELDNSTLHIHAHTYTHTQTNTHIQTDTHTSHHSQNYIVLSGGTDEKPVARPHQCLCLREISEKWRRNQEEPVFMKEP